MNEDMATYPTAIATNPYSMVWKQAWAKMHKKNQMFSAVFCAKPGAGKSWSALAAGWLLDRKVDDIPRFDFKNVAFSAERFADLVKQKHKRGTCIILDDAGIALYSREAMTQTVRDVSKIFQSVRYKNLCILLTLPSFAMLDANVRRLVDAYIEVIDIDRHAKETVCKFHWLDANPHSGKIYRQRQNMMAEMENTITGQTISEPVLLDSVRLPTPPKELTVPYESEKRRCMDLNYEQFHKRIVKGEKKEPSFAEEFKRVAENPDKYLDQFGKMLFGLLMMDGYNENKARRIAVLYNQLNRIRATQL